MRRTCPGCQGDDQGGGQHGGEHARDELVALLLRLKKCSRYR